MLKRSLKFIPVLLLAASALAVHRSGFYPTVNSPKPLLLAWASYRNQIQRDNALTFLLQRGDEELAWRMLLDRNSEPESRWDVLKAPSRSELVDLALDRFRTDLPRYEQLAGEYLHAQRDLQWRRIWQRAERTEPPQRQLALLELLADRGDCRLGSLYFGDKTAIDAGTRGQIEKLYRERCQQLGLLSSAAQASEDERPPDQLQEFVSGPYRSHASERDVVGWIVGRAEHAQLERLLQSPYRDLAALQLWLEPGLFDQDRKRYEADLKGLCEGDLKRLGSFSLDSLTLLRLAQTFPNSRFAQGCKAYTRVRGGDYFGDSLYWSSSGETPRHLPGDEAAWSEWLANYPDHPGADDAAFWLGRCWERQGKRLQAFQHYLDSPQSYPGDGDIDWRRRDKLLWMLDIGLTAPELSQWEEAHPRHVAAPLARYALAVRHAREHRYAEALACSEGLRLEEAQLKVLGENEWDNEWSLAEPHRQRSDRHLPLAKASENLAFQRDLWRRCQTLKGSGSARELYELAHQWSDNGGWRIGYLIVLEGGRSFRWCYTWDAYARDNSKEVRPDGEVIRDLARQANQNEVILALMDQVLAASPPAELVEKARYSRFAALCAQFDSGSVNEIEFLGRDFYRDARDEARLLLRDFPGTPLADDVFLGLATIQERPELQKFLRIHFPDGDRAW